MTGSNAAARHRQWRPDYAVDAPAMVRQHRRGAGDPTQRVIGGRVWRACRTPVGAACIAIEAKPLSGTVEAQAWGSGAVWALDQLPGLLGADDDWTGFEPRNDILADVWRRHPQLRLGHTRLVFESLVPTVIEQKVTGQEAFAGFRALVRRYGEPAPGPGADLGLMLQPEPSRLATIPSWDWLAMHIDNARSDVLMRAARVAERLEAAGRSADDLDRALRTIRGVGVWTSAEVRRNALGDPDAVSFGDYHVAKDIGHVLAGHEFDDRELIEFLEPWRPQRGRVQQLVTAAGLHRPRRGARMAPRTHLPSRS